MTCYLNSSLDLLSLGDRLFTISSNRELWLCV